jgi:hypothetical protein
MIGDYIFNFVPDANIAGFVVHPGEFNSSTVSNKLQIQQCSTDGIISIFGDYSYRFITGFEFSIIGSVGNNGTYTTINSHYLGKTPILNINLIQHSITVSGDGTLIFTNGRIITIQSSADNTGRWAVKSSTYSIVTGNTTIVIKSSSAGDAIPSSTRDGSDLSGTVDGFVETAITAIQVASIATNTTNDGIIEYLVAPSEVGTSLTIPGRGAPMPGEPINRNFVDLLSNFASTTAPIHPISGQLWYDMTKLNVWDSIGSAWVPVTYTSVATNRQLVITAPGQTLVPTPPFVVGDGTLSVYRNGIRLYPDVEYSEISSALIQLTTPAGTGDKLLLEVLYLK